MKDSRPPGFFSELVYYAKRNKRWWILPIIAVLFLFGMLLVVAEIAPVVSPFIYTLF